MQEMWKDIKGYEGLYQVSNLGRIKSLDIIDKKGRKHSGIIRKPYVKNDGYLLITLNKESHKKTYRMNRLVASTFLNNQHNLSDVNHIDEDKENNRVDNLEWCNRKYNINYGTRNTRSSSTKSKPIYAIYPDGTDEFFSSSLECSSKLKISNSNIGAVCNGQRKTAGGLVFEFLV